MVGCITRMDAQQAEGKCSCRGLGEALSDYKVEQEVNVSDEEVRDGAVAFPTGLSQIASKVEIAPEALERLLPDPYVSLPSVRRVAGGIAYQFSKRVFDVLASSLALVVLAFPMAVIAALIKHESSGPALYAQMREGKDGKPFMLYKFRSMRTDAEASGARWAQDDDPRITRFGRVLRKTRMDELPQFWNVLRGDMSLVGPRPERPAFCAAFRERIGGWDQRTLVRPGITGYAQIHGGYDLLPKEKARLDIEYIENRSLLLDLKIMLSTLGVLKSGEGAR